MPTTFNINGRQVSFEEWWDEVIRWKGVSYQHTIVHKLEEVSFLQKSDGTDLSVILEADEDVK